MWSGSSDDIPKGWCLCNGDNNSPDLRDRFVLSSGEKFKTGQTGGEETHTLSISEIPQHSHTFTQRNFVYGDYGYINRDSSSTKIYPFDITSGRWNTGSTSSIGSSASHNNMPPYYVLSY